MVQDPRTQALPGFPTRPHLHHQVTPMAHFSSNTSWHQGPARWEHLRIDPQDSGLDLRTAVYSHVPKIFKKTFELRGTGIPWSDDNGLKLDRDDGCTKLCVNVLNVTELFTLNG